MASLVYLKSKKNGVIYVYTNEKSEKDGKYHRRCIGHLDTFGGEIIPNRKRELPLQPRARSYGINAVLRKISDEIGLTESLQVVFIDTWDSLLSMAFYCLTERGSLTKLEQWMEYNETPRVIPLAEDDIVSIFKVISPNHIEAFFKVWKKRLTDESFILTLFSSSKSEKVTLGSDLDELFPTNVEICYGKNGLLPISYAIRQSSDDMLLFDNKPDWIKKNNVIYFVDESLHGTISIDSLLSSSTKYIVSLPNDDPLFKEIVSKNKIEKNFLDKVVKTVKYRVYGKTMFIHVMYDPSEAEAKVRRFRDIISMCRSELDHKRYVKSHVPIYHKYFLMTGESIVELNSVVEESRRLGFEIVLSNHMSIADKAIKWLLKCKYAKNLFNNIWYDSDITEVKLYLQSCVESRMFVQFLALILSNALERKIEEKRLKESSGDVLTLASRLIRIDMPGRKSPMMSSTNSRQRDIMELLICDDAR